jgi:hypothetical protein
MSRHPEDRFRYKEATRKLNDRTKCIKEYTFQTQIRNLTATGDTDYSLWEATKRLNHRIHQSEKRTRPGLEAAKEAANNFAAHSKTVSN